MTNTEPAVIDRAKRYVDAGEYAAAVAILDPHMRSRPSGAEALNLLGLATFQLGRFGESLTAYQAMWTVVPTDVRAIFGTGISLQKLGDLDEAEAWYAAALAVDPKFERAACRLAELPALRAAVKHRDRRPRSLVRGELVAEEASGFDLLTNDQQVGKDGSLEAADGEELTSYKLHSALIHPRSGQTLRSFLTLGLAGALVAIVIIGLIMRLPPGELTQYAAPISALAGIAIGYWFGTEKA